MPPLHHQVVTATLRVQPRPGDLRDARPTLEDAIAELERGTTADACRARRHGRLGAAVLPTATSRAGGAPPAGRPARDGDAEEDRARAGRRDPLPERPGRDACSRQNDVAVLLRSDRLDAHRGRREGAVRRARDLFRVTSIRRGFVGGGFDGGAEPAEADGDRRRRARRRPDPGHGAELFLGFTSTQKAGLGPREDREPRDARLRRPAAERLLRARDAHAPLAPVRGPRGLVPQLRPPRARRHGVPARARGRRRATQTVPQGPDDVQTARGRQRRLPRDAAHRPRAARSRPRRGSQATFIGPDGTHYPKGTAVPHRADFNTLDNPFFWSADPGATACARRRGRAPFRRLQPDERRLRPQPAGDGRRAARRHEAPVRAGLARAGLQRSAPDDAPPELPRAASRGTGRSRSPSCRE